VSDAPLHILVVEDEPEVRATAVAILSSFGYSVTAAADGEEALAALETAQPDLILSDVRMPGIDGFQLLERVRANPAWHQIPFIIVSAKAGSADLRMGMSLGADDYVTKPYRPLDLKKAIEIRVQRAKQVSDAIAGNRRLLTRILPHELQAALIGVIGYADLMMDAATEGRPLSVDELSEYGRMLRLSGARIFRIVENLLFWARLEEPRDSLGSHGKENRVLEVVTSAGLNGFVGAISRRFGRPLDVLVDCPLRARVQVVTPGFEFVTTHIVENALKYSLPGTQVLITVRTNAAMLVLGVRDSGRGMTQEQIAHIGNSRQLERHDFGQKGLGVGLMLAATFARMSGGNLELRPGIGEKGLIVTLSLPLATDPAAA